MRTRVNLLANDLGVVEVPAAAGLRAKEAMPADDLDEVGVPAVARGRMIRAISASKLATVEGGGWFGSVKEKVEKGLERRVGGVKMSCGVREFDGRVCAS